MLVIFDLDNTLANMKHRVHYVRSKPKNWPAFEKGIPNDTPKEDIVNLYRVFAKSGDHTIILCSGRNEDTREDTEAWLIKHDLQQHERLYMRKSKDYRKDSIVKYEMADEIEAEFGKISVVIDDRDQVVSMWRNERGITCLQCAPGDF